MQRDHMIEKRGPSEILIDKTELARKYILCLLIEKKWNKLRIFRSCKGAKKDFELTGYSQAHHY